MRTIFFGLLVILLVFCFFGCDNGSSPSSTPDPYGINGTWVRNLGPVRIIFSNLEFLYQRNGPSWENYCKGTFTLNEAKTQITFSNMQLWNNSGWESYAYVETDTIAISGNTLSLNGDSWPGTGTYIRQ